MEAVLRIVTDELGAPPRAMRMLETGDGLVLFLTLALDPHTELVPRTRGRAPSRSGSVVSARTSPTSTSIRNP